MADRRLVVPVAVAAILIAGCGSNSNPTVQAGITNGGLTGGAEGRAQQIAKHEVKAQGIALSAAMAIAYTKTSRQDPPQSGSCRPGPLVRLVLTGTFPKKGQRVKAEEIYFAPFTRREAICARAYLDVVPALPSNRDMLWVPGTAASGG